MKQQIVLPSALVPTAYIAINKSRLKQYTTEPNTAPVCYLKNGSEFQIEINNPTRKTILAKIQIDGKQLSQGGLVIKPGEKVFLERYMDIAKKFLFETYEVSNTAEVKNAIEDNGGIKIQFYNESEIVPNPLYNNYGGSINYYPHTLTIHPAYIRPSFYSSNNIGSSGGMVNCTVSNSSTTTLLNTGISSTSTNYTTSVPMMDLFSRGIIDAEPLKSKSLAKPKPNEIETGRVEKGSDSNQKITTVNLTFDFRAFHQVEFKILPLSQKINTIQDLMVKRYCTACGAKQKQEFKFCPICGQKS